MSSQAAKIPRRSRWSSTIPQLIAIVLILGLFVALAIQPTRQLLEQRDRISQMAGDLNHLERSNDHLEHRITRLNDPDYIEQRARTQIGLVRPGETAVIVMPPGHHKPDHPSKKHAGRPAQPVDNGFVATLVRFLGLP